MNISIQVLLFLGIPEQIGVIILAFVIAKTSFSWREAVFTGTTFAIMAYLIRLLPISFGVHTVILMGILIFYLNYFKEIELTRAIFVSLLTVLILIILESSTVPFFMYLFEITREDLLNNHFLRIFISLPYIFSIYVLGFFLKRRNSKQRKLDNAC